MTIHNIKTHLNSGIIAEDLERISQNRILKTENTGHAIQLSTMSVDIHTYPTIDIC